MSFNASQTRAIHHKNGPMLVLAGPGSGKTLVITERTKYLIEVCGIDPAQILVITFTKAAATEMKRRFQRKMNRSCPVTFGTFHAVYFAILKHAYNYSADNIAREEQRYQCMREIIAKEHLTYEDMDKTAKVILDMLNTEAMTSVHVSYGTMVNEIKDVSRSYKEAKMALDVGKIFYSDRNVVAYSSLGIGRLIYQLPMPLCKMFIKEIFGDKSPDEFDEETIATINKFFENSLNVSETSRQLYIHRNTLVYRLDKLQKSTNLDLRVFEDAITFKIALMVVKYMKYMETFEY